ncbi:MAG: flagellar motor protein MotB [Planctomycetota bacterium]|nr:flagellar motor protein MotB [Planctomycetota bacterium]
MFRRNPKSQPEEGGGEPGAPLWMISFTDTVTNLLTFFILLITFSSFGDNSDIGQVGGGFGSSGTGPSIMNASNPTKDGVLPPMRQAGRRPLEGSEKPNSAADLGTAGRPRAPIGILDTEVHRDRKVIHIPSKYIFYGFGSFVTESGQARLGRIAELLKLHPCQVIIGESGDIHQNNSIFNRRNGHLERSWSALRYFVDQAGLSEDRFHVEATTSVSKESYNEEPVLELVLLTRRVYP